MCVLRGWLVEFLFDIREVLFGYVIRIPSVLDILHMLFPYTIPAIIPCLQTVKIPELQVSFGNWWHLESWVW